MRKPHLIYLPAVVLAIASLFLPLMGRDAIGDMNAHEFTLALAFWALLLAVAFRYVRAFVIGVQRKTPRGFEIVPKSPNDE
jgi:hypothetical protein